MTGLAYDPSDKPCKLCGDTGTVEVVPHDGGVNDSQEDECPWCLRRLLDSAQRFSKADIRNIKEAVRVAAMANVSNGGSRCYDTEDMWSRLERKVRRWK